MSLEKEQSALGIYATVVFVVPKGVLKDVQRKVAMSGQREKINYATLTAIIVTKVSSVRSKMMVVTMGLVDVSNLDSYNVNRFLNNLC